MMNRRLEAVLVWDQIRRGHSPVFDLGGQGLKPDASNQGTGCPILALCVYFNLISGHLKPL
jgi:hypothetical protein